MQLNRKSIGIKLWKYFIVFSIIIIAVLWILQTVLLQGVYNCIQKHHIRSLAEEITCQYDSRNSDDVIDTFAAKNSALIFITDTSGNILNSADEYSSSYRGHGIENNPYRTENGRQKHTYRELPENYNDLISPLIGTGFSDTYIFREVETNNGTRLIYASLINDNTVLYINTTLGAVGATVSILRLELCVVTFMALLIGFFIAFFISKRFSKPVEALSEQATRMAEGDFDIIFDKGFCSELDELAKTLDNAAQKLSVNDKLRRELLANVSHDLRTPLTMIKGYAELIRDVSCEDKETEKEDLDVIIREADRLSMLVNDILDFSKLQAGSVQFNFDKVNISRITEAAADNFSAMLAAKNVNIKTNIIPDIFVWGDFHRLEQVLYNLISNAAAHIGNDNTIYVSLFEKQNAVRIEIKDNGIGISKKELPYIWDRYFTSRERKGTGLGLSIVKEILTAHNARFGAESKQGHGSLFWFEIDKCC